MAQALIARPEYTSSSTSCSLCRGVSVPVKRKSNIPAAQTVNMCVTVWKFPERKREIMKAAAKKNREYRRNNPGGKNFFFTTSVLRMTANRITEKK
ncbi:MAG: hypothetical protein PHE58_05435 [Candidatus Omnitrophica bacterium]|nr:hypothetical protein [Candidatus Omnitrophota bacterium]